MEENFASRLKVFMDSIGVASSQFADSCEIPRPSFSQLLSGRNQKVSDVLIGKIHYAYPELSIPWLMFGEGSMLVGGTIAQTESDSDVSDVNECDKPDILTERQDGDVNANLRGLTATQDTTQNAIYQKLEESNRILELQMQIENLQKNPRRVVQINVFYDDSTFETFIPSK